ncbi:hypothetical protein COO60DRAFT_533252 [Scenedesmus sp. NREL 46B-D3]|nr:hypothetical protein COO60DRAFT_533252 [Scenedesmus sp. NREL 46B-D3]
MLFGTTAHAGAGGHGLPDIDNNLSAAAAAAAASAAAERRPPQQHPPAAPPAAAAAAATGPAAAARFNLSKAVGNMNMAGGATQSEERDDLAGQQDKLGQQQQQQQQQQHGLPAAAAPGAAAPAAPAAPPPRAARATTTCKFSINTDSGIIDLTVKVELKLGRSLPPLLVAAAAHTEIEGNMYPRDIIVNRARRDAGCESVTPDFSAACIIVRERAVGQLGKSLPRLIQAMVQGCKYVRVHEGGQQVYLAPVLKQVEDNMELVDYKEFKLASSDQEVFDRVYEDRLGVLNFLKPGEPPASALAATAAAAAAAADEPAPAAVVGTAAAAAAAAGIGGGAGARKVWDANRAAPKPALKSSGIRAVRCSSCYVCVNSTACYMYSGCTLRSAA